MAADGPYDNDGDVISHSSRLASLYGYRILDTDPEPAFNDIAEIAAQLCRAPIALISFVDAERQWFKAKFGIDLRESNLTMSFCARAIQHSALFVVPDTMQDARFATNPFVVGEPHIRFYAGAPMVTPNGHRLGTVCIADRLPRPCGLTAHEARALRALARSVVDKLEARQAHERDRLSEERYRALIDASAAVEFRSRPDGYVLESHGWTAFCGQAEDRYIGHGWLKMLHPDDQARAVAAWDGVRAAERPGTVEYRVRMQDGSFRWALARIVPLRDADGTIREWVGTVADIHEQKIATERLWRAAYYDSLTRLPNRAFLKEANERAFMHAAAAGTSTAVINFDLDNFKDVNETLGHEAGDALLIGVANALRARVPPSATVARLGGDEFAVLLPDVASADAACSIADDLLACIGAPFPHEGRELICRASAGIALFPDHDVRSSELLKNAALALDAAKKAGRNRSVVFRAALRNGVQHRLSVLRSVRSLLDRDRILPFYQPKVAIDTGQVTGFEALLRWKHPDGSIRSPNEIQDAFEDPALSVEIGQRMRSSILRDMRAWREAGIPFGNIALNVAAQEFAQADVAEAIISSLQTADFRPEMLELEVTESVFLGTGGGVGAALQRLHQHGIAIALDDFGTGFASLSHLKEFPVSWLKIDRSFVQDLENGAEGAAIVEAVIGLARNLNIRVVAEGVETSTQLSALKHLGCDVVQGFLIAKPMPASRVPRFLSDWKNHPWGSGDPGRME